MTKTNIIQTLKILALILLISYALDKVVFFSLNKVSDQVMTGQAVGKLNHFLAVKDTTHLLAFGNSRANRHIDVTQLSSSAYNMGIDGIDIAYFATLMETLPKDKEQTVIVHIDTKTMFSDNYQGKDIRALKTKYQRYPAITKALKNSEYLNPLQQFYWSINYNGRVLGILKNYFKPKYDVTNYKGYDPLTLSDGQKSIRDKLLLESGNTTPCLENYKVNDTALKYLKNLIAFCNTHHKQLVVLTTPLYNDSCNNDNDALKSLSKTLAVTYWDFTNLFKTKNTTDLWKDNTHLSKKGAELFTKVLVDSLKLNGYPLN